MNAMLTVPRIRRVAGLFAVALSMTLVASLAVASQAGLARGGSQDEKVMPAKIGEAAPDFTLKSLDGKTYSLKDFRGKTLVIEWTNPDCPYVANVAYGKGVVNDTVKQMKEMGDDFVYIAINSTANISKDDVIAKNVAMLKKHKLTFPVLVDYDGTVGKAYGAKHTPDLYIVDAEGILRFRGGITDDSRGSKGTEATNHVINALKQIKAGETVAPDSPRRWGCSVKYARK